MHGYTYLNFKSIPIDVNTLSNFPKIKGMYEAIESSRRPLMVDNFVIIDNSDNEIEMHSTFASVRVSGTDFLLEIATGLGLITITVTDDDEIKVAYKAYYTPASA